MDGQGNLYRYPDDADRGQTMRPLYLEQPKKEWVGLTDEEIHDTPGYRETREMYRFALALESKLKEKNNG
jgi:hypothetical protein